MGGRQASATSEETAAALGNGPFDCEPGRLRRAVAQLNRVHKPFGSASSACTTWRGLGIRSDPGRTPEAANLWVTTRATPHRGGGPSNVRSGRSRIGTIWRPSCGTLREQAYALEVWERDDVASGSVSPLSGAREDRGLTRPARPFTQNGGVSPLSGAREDRGLTPPARPFHPEWGRQPSVRSPRRQGADAARSPFHPEWGRQPPVRSPRRQGADATSPFTRNMDSILFDPETSVRRAVILALGTLHGADTFSPAACASGSKTTHSSAPMPDEWCYLPPW